MGQIINIQKNYNNYFLFQIRYLYIKNDFNKLNIVNIIIIMESLFVKKQIVFYLILVINLFLLYYS